MNRYSSIRQINNTNDNVGKLGTPYYKTVSYPDIIEDENDIYVITNFGDRLDSLSHQFYKDTTLYWIIAVANPTKVSLGSLYLPIGTQLRIPVNLNAIIDDYNELNIVGDGKNNKLVSVNGIIK
jgi:LysM repeat protein